LIDPALSLTEAHMSDHKEAPTPVADSGASDCVEILGDNARDRLIEKMARAMNVATDGHDRYLSGYVKSAAAAHKVVADHLGKTAAKPVSVRAAPRKCLNCGQVIEPGTAHAVDANHQCSVMSTAGIVAQGAKPVSVDAQAAAVDVPEWPFELDRLNFGAAGTAADSGLTLQQAALAHATEHGAAACVIPIAGTELVVAVGTRENLVQLLTPPTESTGEPTL
jgi:hypothetical protein